MSISFCLRSNDGNGFSGVETGRFPVLNGSYLLDASVVIAFLSNDLWIAAIAMQYQLIIATRDKHFHEIEGLIVEEW